MLNRIAELKNKATERADYYNKIGFPNLANEFTEFVNILNEMEAVVRERDKLKEKINNQISALREARDGEECMD
jgi:uncharacterized coiled-coil DUF342 family protein